MKKLLLIIAAITLLASCAFAENLSIGKKRNGSVTQSIDYATNTASYVISDNTSGLSAVYIYNDDDDWTLWIKVKSISFSIAGLTDNYQLSEGNIMAVAVQSFDALHFYNADFKGNGDYVIDSFTPVELAMGGGLTEGDVIKRIMILPNYNVGEDIATPITKADLPDNTFTVSDFKVNAQAVPEPSSALGLLTACSGLAAYRLRRKTSK